MKSSKVCITTKSTLASLLFKGLATKHTTVKWSILLSCNQLIKYTSKCVNLLILAKLVWSSQHLFRGKVARERLEQIVLPFVNK